MKASIIILGVAANLLLAGCRAPTDFASPPRKSYEATGAYKQSFLASEVLEGAKEITEGGRYETTSLMLKENDASTKSFKQNDRKVNIVSKKQGRVGDYKDEEFDIADAGMLDILVVIDDSNSMTEEQAELGSKLGPLLSEIKDTSWQIAVISMSNPCVNGKNLIKKGEENAAKKFADAVTKPWDRLNLEQGFPMAIQSLQGQCNGTLRPWLRTGSSLAILFLSDEDNCGSTPVEQARCANLYGKNSDEFLQFLFQLREPDLARVYALVKEDTASCIGTAPVVGQQYLNAVEATGGTHGSICANDYTTSLNSVSKSVKSIVKKNFSLSFEPDMREFKVYADGVEVAADQAWKVEGAKVTIIPEVFATATKIRFVYSHSAVPRFDRLPVVGSVLPSSLVVMYDKVVQSDSVYFHDEANSELVFSPQPPDDVVVDVEWRENTEVLSKFDLNDQGIREDTLEVRVNGVSVDKSSYIFNAATQSVEFRVPPADAASIDVRFKTENHKIVRYDVPLNRKPQAVTIRDVASGEPIDAVLEDQTVIVAAKEVVNGRAIAVDVDFGNKPLTYDVALPEMVLMDTLTVTVNGADNGCKIEDESADPASDSEVAFALAIGEATKVHVVCPAENPDYSTLKIAYKYETAKTNVFNLPPSIPIGDKGRPTAWKVFINGTETKNYQRTERSFTLEEKELSPGAKIDIEAKTWQKID